MIRNNVSPNVLSIRDRVLKNSDRHPQICHIVAFKGNLVDIEYADGMRGLVSYGCLSRIETDAS
jgi:hypothetical protein